MRDSVVWALGTVGLPAIAPLVDAAGDEDAELRGEAVLALGRFSEHAAMKLPVIIKSLDDSAPRVRRRAARAVFGHGESAHRDRSNYDEETFSMLVAAIDRIAQDQNIDVDAERLDRVRTWLRPGL